MKSKIKIIAIGWAMLVLAVLASSCSSTNYSTRTSYGYGETKQQRFIRHQQYKFQHRADHYIYKNR